MFYAYDVIDFKDRNTSYIRLVKLNSLLQTGEILNWHPESSTVITID